MAAVFPGKITTLARIAAASAIVAVAAILCESFPFPVAAQTVSGQDEGTVSVTAYGADPTGSRDSTQAFVQAISSGKSIFVPPGHYAISNYDTLVLNHPNQVLFGAGRDASTLDYNGPCQQGVHAGSYSAVTLTRPGDVVRNLAITSRTAEKCILIGIRMASNHGLVDNVAVSQMWHVGIGVQGNHNSVLDSDIEYDHTGIYVGGDHQLVRGNYVSNHWSTSGEPHPWTPQSLYWDGIMSDGLTNSIIDSNTVEDNGQSGIYTGGKPFPSYGNVISFNIVRHNRNEGIDQGISGTVDHNSNYIGHLVIVGNTSIDNFRRDIWLSEVDGAVIADNNAEHTANYSGWWARAVRKPYDTPIPCQVWEVTTSSKSDNIIFVDNVCSQADSAYPAVLFDTSRGSVLGRNTIRGERRISPDVDHNSNIILPDSDSREQ